MPLHSAGLLVFDDSGAEVRVFLAHMGGPLWARKDSGAWSIPKGLHDPDEEPEDAARREFEEEVGVMAPAGVLTDLGEVRQRSGKVVRAFAVKGDPGLAFVASNAFTMEWPPRSGRLAEFPEIDGAQWFTLAEARGKLVAGQVAFLDALATRLTDPTG
ncbi:NUDIX domain-containing protein [Tessaracoccus antarcticus]|uniref:NUDIX domain-containing protein n=1 Tax=Tessaracoccus antarcticus TaxID=2479848 RepID=A0A3M0GBD5_9ACTN|nr:NUDIX domain-containing protein [Tessaracoccus antarcticus]RMB59862.1 NUDIX domain-containing protein [Tessaracoccus antarcticus]